MRFIVMNENTGKLVQPNDTVISFRGETATLVSADQARGNGRTGKVTVQWSNSADGQGYYYDTVFGLVVATSDQAFPCGCPASTFTDEGHRAGCRYITT